MVIFTQTNNKKRYNGEKTPEALVEWLKEAASADATDARAKWLAELSALNNGGASSSATSPPALPTVVRIRIESKRLAAAESRRLPPLQHVSALR